MEKIKLSPDEYKATVKEYRNRNGYAEMSDEEKTAFDEKLDEVLGGDDFAEDDSGENEIGEKVLRKRR